MKQLSTKQKIIYIVIIAIILAGISIMCTIGFNLDLMYSNNKRIDIYIGKDFSLNDIKNIANEVLDKKVVLQTEEILDDYVSITVADLSEEQIKNLETKIYEKYEVKESLQKSTTTDIPSINVIDVMKPYVFPIILTTAIVAIYLGIRYRKQNALKVCAKTISGLIIVEALYFSIVAITRIPFGNLIMPIALLIYIAAIMILVCNIKSKE